ncbi:MAG TPA: peptidase U32 family protein [Candidatus Nanoarchaeia archaeon]|nr:peptidase U32 family protein [Candidatus Nanoarchaeia archaeon]
MKPELLAPAQDFVSLHAAIKAGADAVFFGVKDLNMRKGAKNFSVKESAKVIDLCHKNNVKAYCTLNSIVYDKEIQKLQRILRKLKQNSVDAIICWDYSVINECEKLNLPIHLSTQASVSNFQTVLFLKKKIKNLKRINLARELSLLQIKSIIQNIKKQRLGIEIETFIHGAMCISISGRCFLSQEVFGKSANRGECLQPCRRKYIIKDVEEKHEFELGEDYVLSPKDLCALPVLDQLLKAGIHTFKIEGRNRSPEYVKIVTETYREAIDNYTNLSKIKERLIAKLQTIYNRGFSTGFYMGKPLQEWSKAYGSKATKKKLYVGKVINFFKKPSVAEILIESAGVQTGDSIMFQGNKTGVVQQTLTSLQKDDTPITKADKTDSISIKTETMVRKNDKVYKLVQSSSKE